MSSKPPSRLWKWYKANFIDPDKIVVYAAILALLFAYLGGGFR